MLKLECIIRQERLEAVKDALAQNGGSGMTVSQVAGCGLQHGWREFYRGVTSAINLLPKVKVEVIVRDEQLAQMVEVICQAARTGEIGDGKIFVYPVSDVIRIRTGEKGKKAI